MKIKILNPVNVICLIVLDILALCLHSYSGLLPSGDGRDTNEIPEPWYACIKGVRTTNPLLSKIATASAARSDMFIKGNCYIGPDSSNVLAEGPIRFYAKPVQPAANDYSGVNWEQVSPVITRSNGAFFFWQSGMALGNYYVVVNPSPYALQWLDGTSVFSQPKPLSFTGDTSFCNVHLTMGGKIIGILKDPASDTLKGWTAVSLVDKNGFTLFRQYLSMTTHEFSFSGIPNGEYAILARNTDYYETQLYPNASSIASAQLFTFPKSGIPYDTVRLVLKRVAPVIALPSGTLSVAAFDSVKSGLSIVILNFDRSGLSYMSSSSDSITTSVPANSKFFIARVLSTYGTNRTSLSWYPGSFFKADAETLSVRSGSKSFVWLPLAENGGYLSGKLPIINDRNVSFSPIFLNSQKKPLGGDAYIDLQGNFTATIAAGLYDIRCIPVTDGDTICTGMSSIAIKGITVKKDQQNMFGPLTCQNYSHAITGSFNCKKDAVVACFDTVGDLVSVNAINIKSFYERKAGAFGRFFSCDYQLLPSPHQLKYAISFLPPGRYALVKIEPLDTLPRNFSISWYGGPERRKLITAMDDIASLSIPEGVQWITVDSATPITDAARWSSHTVYTAHKLQVKNPGLMVRRITTNRLALSFRAQNSPSELRVFACNGSLLENILIKPGADRIVIENRKIAAAGFLIFELRNQGNNFVARSGKMVY